MQLASQTEEPDQKASPSTYAALIDSLFQNPAPMFAGSVMRCRCRGHDGAEDRQLDLLWPCVALSRAVGRRPRLDMHRYKSRRSALTADEAARWEVRYQIGAMVYAVALGLWCTVALLGSDDAVAHMICLTVTHRLRGWRCAAGPMDGRGSSMCRLLLACGPTGDGAGASMAAPITSAWRCSARCFSSGAEADLDRACSGFSFAHTDGARARGGAG